MFIHKHTCSLRYVDTCERGWWVGVYAGVWKWIESFLVSGIFLFSQHTHTPRATLKARPRSHLLIQEIVHTHKQACIYVSLFAHRCMCVCVRKIMRLCLILTLSHTHTHDKSMHHHLVLLPQSVTSLDFDLFSSPDAMAYFQPCLEDKNVGGQKIRNSSATCFQLSLACF